MTRSHTVLDVSFRRGQLRCSCGTVVEGRPAPELAAAFQPHRREVGERPLSVAQAMTNHREYS